MSAGKPYAMRVSGHVNTRRMTVRCGMLRARNERSPDRVIGVPQSGLLATNLLTQKGA